MYCRCGSAIEARQAFDSLPGAIRHSSIAVWNSLLLGYMENEDPWSALEIFTALENQECCAPNSVSYLAALKACCSLAGAQSARDGVLETGKRIYSAVAVKGFVDSDIKIANAVIEMFAKLGRMVEARRVFDRMAIHSCVSWTVLMLGYVENGDASSALLCLDAMEAEKCLPDARALVAALKACATAAQEHDEDAEEISGRAVKLHWLDRGMAIHSQAVSLGLDETNNGFLASSLVDMYSKCGSMLDARMAFDRACSSLTMEIQEVAMWNALLHGYVENGEPEMAVRVMERMPRSRSRPNARSFSIALKACASMASGEEGTELENGMTIKVAALERGMALHAEASKLRFDRDGFVASAMVGFYAACGSMVDARGIFDRMIHHDRLAWTVLMLGYASNRNEDYDDEARLSPLLCLELMRRQRLALDPATLVAALKASSRSLYAIRIIHSEINRSGVQILLDSPLATSLVDAYGKLGDAAKALRVFDDLPSSRKSSKKSGAMTWTAALSALSRRGDGDGVLELFERMVEEGVDPDSATLQCVLSSCSHSGRIEAGRVLFESMEARFAMRPSAEHYVCMVDLLCRANELSSALALLRSMPFEPSSVAWTILLAACEVWRNVDIARVAFQALQALGKTQGSYAYVLMSRILGGSQQAEAREMAACFANP